MLGGEGRGYRSKEGEGAATNPEGRPSKPPVVAVATNSDVRLLEAQQLQAATSMHGKQTPLTTSKAKANIHCQT